MTRGLQSDHYKLRRRVIAREVAKERVEHARASSEQAPQTPCRFWQQKIGPFWFESQCVNKAEDRSVQISSLRYPDF